MKLTPIPMPSRNYESGIRLLTDSDFRPGWSEYGSADYTLKVWRSGNNVYGGGYINFSGDDPSNQRNLFSLPAGWRPFYSGTSFPLMNLNGSSAARIDVDRSGLFRLQTVPSPGNFFIPPFVFATRSELPVIKPGVPT